LMRSPITQNGLSWPIVIVLVFELIVVCIGYAGTALRRCSMRSLAFLTADEASAE
jgi:hypothetical protein